MRASTSIARGCRAGPVRTVTMLAALASAAMLAAAPAWPAAGERLRRADADRDGYLSRAEAQRASTRLAREFDSIDANRDGRLSPQEIRNAGRGRSLARTRAQDAGQSHWRIDARFAAADRDGDGLLSRAEAQAALPRVAAKFARIDSNADGGIAAQELRAWLERRRSKRGDKP